MRASTLIARIGLLSLALLAGGCDSGGGVGGGPTAVFTRDHNGVGVPEVDVYLDFDTTPFAATDTRGWLDLYLSGTHSLHFAKPGYATRSYINLYSTPCGSLVFCADPAVEMTPYQSGTTTGTAGGTITNSRNGDQMVIQARRQSDALSAFASANATGATVAYTTRGVAQGTNDLFVYPGDVGFDAVSSYFGYSPGVPVSSVAPTIVDLALTRGIATSFNMTASNGFAGGTMRAGYVIWTNGAWPLGAVPWGAEVDPYYHGSAISLSTAPAAGESLSGAAVNVPPIDPGYPGAVYGLRVQAYDTASPTANYETRTETHVLPSIGNLRTAASSQSFALGDDNVTPATPAHGETDTGVTPTFSWSLSGTPDTVEIDLYEYVPGRGYSQRVWSAVVWGTTSAVTLPATTTLRADTAYAYNIYASRLVYDPTEYITGFQRNGREIVKFSTGPTPPP